MQNIYGIIKPKGPTSHDIIYALRRITGIKKIGHAGTLDPLASGVLVVAISREGTREIPKLIKNEKEYIAKIKLGETSTTDDAEGVICCSNTANEIPRPARNDIDEVIKQFIGKIKQVPPIYSSIKIKGKPAHRRVRHGEDIKLEPREVEIKSIEIINYQWPYLTIKTTTGSGVYIRSLARDIGEKLKIGAYLADLERTRVGDYTKEKSYTLEEFEKYWFKK